MTDETTHSAASTLLDAIADGQTDAPMTDPVEPEAVETEAASSDQSPEQTADPADEHREQVTAADEAGYRPPPYIPPVREDAEAQLAQIEQDMLALEIKRSDGEIEDAAYVAESIRLHDARNLIWHEMRRAEDAAQAASHADRNAWQTANQRFLAANPEYEDMTRQEPLAAIARMVMAEEANRHKAPEWILGEAKRRLESAFAPSTPAAQEPAPRTEADIKAAAKAKAVAAKASAPISISDIPGTPGAAASEFERLDQAGSGFSKIDALMSLPPEKLEAWMNRRI